MIETSVIRELICLTFVTNMKFAYHMWWHRLTRHSVRWRMKMLMLMLMLVLMLVNMTQFFLLRRIFTTWLNGDFFVSFFNMVVFSVFRSIFAIWNCTIKLKVFPKIIWDNLSLIKTENGTKCNEKRFRVRT